MKEFLIYKNRLKKPKNKVTIGIIGKYVELQDAYKSISESLIHAGSSNSCKIDIQSQMSHIVIESIKHVSINDGVA